MNIILCDINFWKDFFSIVQSIATVTALIVGGWWTYKKFIMQRENRPLIVFSADIEFHALKDDYWIVELIAYIENKGKVQHRVNQFDFILEALSLQSKVKLNENHREQVDFPLVLVKNSFLPGNKNNEDGNSIKSDDRFSAGKPIDYFFIEPGLKNKYSYIARIPLSVEIVLMHTWFRYEFPDEKEENLGHTAEVTKRVPRSMDEILPKKKEEK
jgi:hypothetical protein